MDTNPQLRLRGAAFAGSEECLTSKLNTLQVLTSIGRRSEGLTA
jgi:hypothetical protein